MFKYILTYNLIRSNMLHNVGKNEKVTYLELQCFFTSDTVSMNFFFFYD